MKKETSKALGWAIAIITLFACISFFASCKTYGKIEKEYIHDTIRKTDVKHDSIDRWHTHYEYLQGDTIKMIDSVLIKEYHTDHDTVYEKSVEYKDKEVIKEIEKKVNVWWPCIAISAAVLTAGLIFFFYVKKKSYLCK